MSQPTQREINDAEWRNPDNWSGSWPYNAYFSKRDSRLFVPQYFNSILCPHTINFGHRWGFTLLTSLYVVIVLFFAYLGWSAGRGR